MNGMAPPGMDGSGMGDMLGDMPGDMGESGLGGGYGGGPPPMVASGPPLPRIQLDGAALQAAALFLWSPEMVSAIGTQLQSASDPASAADVVTLAAGMPMQSIRHELFEAFTRWHATGANSLMGTGLFDHNSHDPGMLLVLKALPRQRPARNSNAAPTPDSWAIASSQVVLNLRDRLKQISATLPRYDGPLPVRLHKNAISEVSVVMTMPGDFATALGAAAPTPTKVFYTRTSFTPTTVKEQAQVADHYETRAAAIRRADPQRGLLWMDGVKTEASGARRTMDVIIQQAGQSQGNNGFGGGIAGPGGNQGGASYSIEVIVVEAADPKDSEAAVTSAGGQ